jgi:hypothetical protein
MFAMFRHSLAPHIPWLLAIAFLTSCGNDRQAISEVEVRPAAAEPQAAKPEAACCPSDHSAAKPPATSADRFGGYAHPPPVPKSNLGWEAPESWIKRPSTSMRVANFAIGEGENQGQCYITILPGPAGGVEANLNRWRLQMGASAATPEELAALPRIPCLGQESALLSMGGNFRGLGSKEQDEAYLFGVACPLEGRTLFVKMMGPESVISPERERFIAFCASLSFEKEAAATP